MAKSSVTQPHVANGVENRHAGAVCVPEPAELVESTLGQNQDGYSTVDELKHKKADSGSGIYVCEI